MIDDNEKYIQLIKALTKRPLMHMNDSKYSSIVIFLNGVMFAPMSNDAFPDCVWIRWISLKVNIWSTAWGWDRMVLHHYESEENAIKALPDLYTEYFHDIETMGVETILQNHKKKFRTGERIPVHTDTKSILGNK